MAEACSCPFAILNPTPGSKVDCLRHVEAMVEALVVCMGEDHHHLPLLLHQPCHLDSVCLQQLRLDDDALVPEKIVANCCLSGEQLPCQRLESVFDFALQMLKEKGLNFNESKTYLCASEGGTQYQALGAPRCK